MNNLLIIFLLFHAYFSSIHRLKGLLSSVSQMSACLMCMYDFLTFNACYLLYILMCDVLDLLTRFSDQERTYSYIFPIQLFIDNFEFSPQLLKGVALTTMGELQFLTQPSPSPSMFCMRIRLLIYRQMSPNQFSVTFFSLDSSRHCLNLDTLQALIRVPSFQWESKKSFSEQKESLSLNRMLNRARQVITPFINV